MSIAAVCDPSKLNNGCRSGMITNSATNDKRCNLFTALLDKRFFLDLFKWRGSNAQLASGQMLRHKPGDKNE